MKTRIRDKLKRLKLKKAELNQILKEIETEKMKVGELKYSYFEEIKKVIIYFGFKRSITYILHFRRQ